MTDFNELIQLQPASSQIVTIGRTFDVEGDEVTLSKYTIQDLKGKVELVPWVLFKNNTKSDAIDFQMNPPASVAGNQYVVQIELVDSNQDEPGLSRFEFIIEILKDATFNPVFDAKKETEEKQESKV